MVTGIENWYVGLVWCVKCRPSAKQIAKLDVGWGGLSIVFKDSFFLLMKNTCYSNPLPVLQCYLLSAPCYLPCHKLRHCTRYVTSRVFNYSGFSTTIYWQRKQRIGSCKYAFVVLVCCVPVRWYLKNSTEKSVNEKSLKTRRNQKSETCWQWNQRPQRCPGFLPWILGQMSTPLRWWMRTEMAGEWYTFVFHASFILSISCHFL